MKIHIVGQFSPPINGLSEALDSIINSETLKTKYELSTIDIKNNRRFFINILKILKANTDIYYFTISQSMLGNLRDMVYLFFMLIRNKRVVIHYHGGYYKKLYKKMPTIQKRINKILLNKVDYIIVLSSGLVKLFDHIVPKKKIIACENFVSDVSFLSKTEFNKKLDLIENSKKIEILYLSNFIKSKGYFELLKSIKVVENQQNINLNFAGSFSNANDEEEFFNFIKENKLESNVTYHGVVKGNAKKALLRKAAVFVLPSKYPKEGQPISILEAMANGCYVISTNHAGIPEIVEDRGILMNDNDYMSIAKAINQYSNFDETHIKSVLCKARNYIIDNFKEKDYIERIDEIICLVGKNK